MKVEMKKVTVLSKWSFEMFYSEAVYSLQFTLQFTLCGLHFVVYNAVYTLLFTWQNGHGGCKRVCGSQPTQSVLK